MYIKDINKQKDFTSFVCMPVYDTHRLVNRARFVVDDYFTFINYDKYTENFNFRKYCIEPVFEEIENGRRLVAVKVSCLLFYDKEFTLVFYKTGDIRAYFPSGSEKFDRDLFDQVIERTVKYVSVS